MKNPNDPIGNRIRDLPACSAVPQPTTSPRAPEFKKENNKNMSSPYNMWQAKKKGLFLAIFGNLKREKAKYFKIIL